MWYLKGSHWFESNLNLLSSFQGIRGIGYDQLIPEIVSHKLTSVSGMTDKILSLNIELSLTEE